MKSSYEKSCEFCKESFKTFRKSQRYCSNLCSIKDNPKPQNQQKYKITLDLLKEADKNTAYGESKLQYVANILNCNRATVSYQAKKLGFSFTKEPRQKVFYTTTKVERKYVYSVGCIVCGETRVMDAAHFIPAREGGHGMVENIIPLCPTHHRLYDYGKLNENELDKFITFLFVKYPNLALEFEKARNEKSFKRI